MNPGTLAAKAMKMLKSVPWPVLALAVAMLVYGAVQYGWPGVIGGAASLAGGVGIGYATDPNTALPRAARIGVLLGLGGLAMVLGDIMGGHHAALVAGLATAAIIVINIAWRRRLLLLMVLSTLAACAPRGCAPVPHVPSTSGDAGPGPVDAGPCDPNTDANACGCCIAGETRQCPPGVPVPDAGVITLPVCGGG